MKINEIAFADELSAPKLSIHGEIMGIDHYQDQGYDVYAVVDKDKNILTSIHVGAEESGYLPIRRVGNFSKIKGLSIQLLNNLLDEGLKFIVNDDESLTKYGKDWISSIITNSQLLNIMVIDQNGKYPDIKQIELEWKKSQMELRNGNPESYGPTKIYISR